MRGLQVITAIGLGLSYWSIIARVPEDTWNAARLYPAFLLAGGMSPYPAEAGGPITGWIYGPLLPVLQLPATIAPTITGALMLAAGINLSILVVPLWLIVDMQARLAGQSPAERLSSALLLAGAIPLLPTLRGYLYWIHCDQAAVGLSLLSCYVLCRGDGGRRVAVGAAILAVLAVAAKQIAIAVPIAQAAYLFFLRKDRAFGWQYLQGLLCAAVVIAGLVQWCFGRDALVHNLWLVPAGHPLKDWNAIGDLAMNLLAQAGWFSLACVGAAVLLKAKWRAGRPGNELVRLLLTVTIVQVPLSLLGAAKLGGGTNSFHALAYLFASGMAWLIGASHQIDHIRLKLLVPAVGLAGCLAVTSSYGFNLRPSGGLEHWQAWAAQRPQQVYFPQNPLITWFSERQPYHLEYGVMDHALAGYTLDADRYFRHLPQDLTWVVYLEPGPGEIAPQVITDLRPVSQLGGMKIYRRDGARPVLTSR